MPLSASCGIIVPDLKRGGGGGAVHKIPMFRHVQHAPFGHFLSSGENASRFSGHSANFLCKQQAVYHV